MVKTFLCENCGKEKQLFDIAKWNRSKRHYCSRRCSNLMRKGKNLTREHRAKVIRTLSRSAMKGKIPWNKGMTFPQKSGKNCHLWKGGITKLAAQIRTSEEYRIWRRKCLERDNFTCTKCGQRGGEKHVDHTIAFCRLLEKFKITSLVQAKKCKGLWNVKNGKTMCVPCHAKTDTFPKNLKAYRLSKTLAKEK